MKPRLTQKQSQGPRLRQRQELLFSGSALPLTVELARALKSVLQRKGPSLAGSWPYPDRVLVWLMPSFRKDVVAFHTQKSPGLVDIFKPWQLESLDRALLGELGRRAERLEPGIIKLLADIAAALQEQDEE